MTKDKFVDTLNKMRDISDEQDTFLWALKEFGIDVDVPLWVDKYLDLLIDLLADGADGKYGNYCRQFETAKATILCFIFEYSFGRTGTLFYTADGSEVRVDSAEALWRFLHETET